ncbi:uncharacterized protein [Rutidosis leptorrhynchoides]|uniref:uncharacterized protein n=1 Tax=Rutidosis leptorrhynchoides TaxID=125765 RepID=UPI003A98D33C
MKLVHFDILCASSVREYRLRLSWIHSYRLRRNNFWLVKPAADSSWGWRKILSIRNTIRPHIIHQVGDGRNTSVLYDIWCDYGPLVEILTNRETHRAAISIDSNVSQFVNDSGWSWPDVLSTKYPLLLSTDPPDIGKDDVVRWRDVDGVLHCFSVSKVWDTIRYRQPKVLWYSVIWFAQNIPRHAFIAWLLMKQKLKTQDMLKPWDMNLNGNGGVAVCTLCQLQPDSNTHLFFECMYASRVWDQVKQLIQIPISGNCWQVFVQLLAPITHRRVSRVVVAKLLFAASIYFIWQERNARLFSNKSRTSDLLFQNIFSTVRYKLLSLRFKDSVQVRQLKMLWKIT